MNKLKILSYLGIALSIVGGAISAIVAPAVQKAENQKYIDSLMKK